MSRKSLHRALRIASALLKALEERGFTVEVTKPDPRKEGYYLSRRESTTSKTRVRMLDTCVEFGIEEAADTIRTQPETVRRRGYDGTYYDDTPPAKVEYKPNGKLTLTIKSWTSGRIRRNWRDSKTQRLEDLLDDFIVGLIRAAEQKRIDELEKERRRQARLEEQIRREEEARRQEIETARIRDLETRVANWTKAKASLEFVDAVEAAARERCGDTPPNSDLGRWLAWASERAAKLRQTAVGETSQSRPDLL